MTFPIEQQIIDIFIDYRSKRIARAMTDDPDRDDISELSEARAVYELIKDHGVRQRRFEVMQAVRCNIIGEAIDPVLR